MLAAMLFCLQPCACEGSERVLTRSSGSSAMCRKMTSTRQALRKHHLRCLPGACFYPPGTMMNFEREHALSYAARARPEKSGYTLGRTPPCPAALPGTIGSIVRTHAYRSLSPPPPNHCVSKGWKTRCEAEKVSSGSKRVEEERVFGR